MGQRRHWKWTIFSLSNAGWNPKKSEENIKELKRAEKMKPGRLKLSGATVQPRFAAISHCGFYISRRDSGTPHFLVVCVLQQFDTWWCHVSMPSDKHWKSDKEIIIIAVSGYENMDNTLHRLLSATYTNGEIWNIPLGNNT
jgi:hypothetical protein